MSATPGGAGPRGGIGFGGVALLQLASPALPIGGYSYSGGLEWGVDSGRVVDEASALEWIGDALALGQASFDGPLMVAALRAARRLDGALAPACPDGAARRVERAGDTADTRISDIADGSGIDDVDDVTERGRGAGDPFDALLELNGVALAARETSELRLESEQMGYSLGRWLAAVCPSPDDDARIAARLSPMALPVAWAIAAARLGLDERDALLAQFWTFTENQAMVLMKSVPMGQIAAQRLLRTLAPAIDAAIARALELPRADWSSAAPLLAVASARHETQYSRLFRS
jgi:urease accessory protein